MAEKASAENSPYDRRVLKILGNRIKNMSLLAFPYFRGFTVLHAPLVGTGIHSSKRHGEFTLFVAALLFIFTAHATRIVN